MVKQTEKTKKISVIIPACNEERYLRQTIESLHATEYPSLEIIVVVNGSSDATLTIADDMADHVLHITEPLSPSAARNKGAEIAQGDIFVFLDADSTVSKYTLREIAQHCKTKTFGTCFARGDKVLLPTLLFFSFKNMIHYFGMYKGIVALLFCDRQLFSTIKGFNDKKHVGEYKDFVKRAIANSGKYTCISSGKVTTSVRRFEENGYVKTLWFWTKWALLALFKLRSKRKVAKEYEHVR
jgi:glycosyltransferase involved in cell wall biosynthesis